MTCQTLRERRRRSCSTHALFVYPGEASFLFGSTMKRMVLRGCGPNDFSRVSTVSRILSVDHHCRVETQAVLPNDYHP